MTLRTALPAQHSRKESASLVTRKCACGREFKAKAEDVRRGWAKSCSKSCAALLREKKTGNYARFCAQRDSAIKADHARTFSDAHLFSNEDHDCNKD
jgi:hypothetical protein